MQMYTAKQLRQIHEDRIAPYVKGNEDAKPKNRKRRSWTFNLFNQVK